MVKAIDQDIALLLDEYSGAADRLADYMTQLVMEDDPRERQAIYMLIIAILLRLQEMTRNWSYDAIYSAYRESTINAQGILLAAGVEDLGAWNPENEYEIEAMSQAFTSEMHGATASIQANAARAKNGSSLYVFAGLGASIAIQSQLKKMSAGRSAVLRANMRNAFREGIVSVLGRNGRYYHYALDYYANMAATRARYQAMSQATLNVCAASGWDLVRVSPNPSTIGDYCDEYRGKVFSISGGNTTYPTVDMLPGGGCPMHPHCRHYLIPFDGIDQHGPVDPSFLAMGSQVGVTPNSFQALWKSRQVVI